MKKAFLISFLNFAVALTLCAQTEPQKSPAMGKSSAPGAHGPKKSETQPTPPMSTSGTKGQPASETQTQQNAKPIDQSNFDTSVKPSDDFFLYANGGWIKRTEIPPDQTRWGSSNQLIERNNDALHEIAEKAATAKSNDPTTQKVGDYFTSGMDEKAIEARKAKPLQDELDKIDAIKDRNDV